MSQYALADRMNELGVSMAPPSISMYETGRRMPEWDRLVVIAAIFGVGVWLLVQYGEMVARGLIKAGEPMP